jgi:predicted nucleic acid-binding protein
MSYLLDTNVVSEFRRQLPDAGATTWIDSVRSSQLFLSVMVVGELRQGVERLATRDPQQAAAIGAWCEGLVRGYSDRIVPVTQEIAGTWGRLNAATPLPVVDGLMAATALVHDWTLVTRNTADVERTGVKVLNPFSEAA